MSVVALGLTAIGHAEPTTTSDVKYVGEARGAAPNPVEDGDRELAQGRFEQALAFYKIAIDQGLRERHVFREAGRAAHALQKFEVAIEYLTRANEMSARPDPELLYLLGEAHWAAGDSTAAKAIHRRALAAIGTPKLRIEKLWVARMQARLGQRDAADAIYAELAAADPRDTEAILARAELHASAASWQTAEQVIRQLLHYEPDHPRGRAMLAWVLEAQGRTEAEIEVRKTLVRDGARAESLRDYGRALERSGDWAAARDVYRKAAALPDGGTDLELARALERVDLKMSVEVAAGVIGRTDPNASSLTGFAGIALPFGRAYQLGVVATYELATADGGNVHANEVRAGAVFREGDASAIAGVKVGVIQVRPDASSTMSERDVFAPGAFISASSGELAGHLTLTIDGELGTIWRESPRAVFEGGRTNGVTGHVFVTGMNRRLILDTGVQARQLSLDAPMGTPHANQLLAWGGADVIAWADFSREARGQILDDDLLRPTYAADSVVFGYRHYELFGDTDPAFAQRLSLADRASIDELSVTVRKVFAHGTVAVEGRGGYGRDWVRELNLGRGGVAVWISPTRRSRLSLSFDVARESVRALAGERRTGWMNYHVDL